MLHIGRLRPRLGRLPKYIIASRARGRRPAAYLDRSALIRPWVANQKFTAPARRERAMESGARPHPPGTAARVRSAVNHRRRVGPRIHTPQPRRAGGDSANPISQMHSIRGAEKSQEAYLPEKCPGAERPLPCATAYHMPRGRARIPRPQSDSTRCILRPQAYLPLTYSDAEGRASTP